MSKREKHGKRICAGWGVVAFIICMLLSTLFAVPARAEAKKVVRVGYYLHNNFQEGGPGEVKSGYGYEYLQMLRNYTGWEYEYVYADSWEEQVSMLQKGEVDLILHAFKTTERMETMSFSVEPMGREMNYLYTRGNHPSLVAGDIDSINGKIIGCMAGDFRYSIFTEWCAENGIECTVLSYEDLTKMHEELLSGTIDAIIGSDFTSSSYKGDWVTLQRLGDEPIYIAVALGRKDLLEEVNTAQSKILAINPYYPEEVRQKYQDVVSTHVLDLTDEQKEELKRRGTLSIGYCDGYRPIAYTDSETGELQGMLKDYLEAMTNTYGINFKVVAYEEDTVLLDALQKGEVDIVAPVGYGYGVAEQYGISITNPMTEAAMIALYKGTKGTETKEIFDRITVLKTSLTGEGYIDHYYPNAEIIYVDTVQEAIDLVTSGTAESFVIRSSSWSRYARKYSDISTLQILNLPNTNEINMAVRTEDVTLIPILNKGIKLLTDADIRYATIAYSEAGEEVTLWQLIQKNSLTVHLTVFAVVLLIVLLFVVYRLKTEHRYAGKLKDAKEEAERANLAKSTFLTSMSHDIRTPMNAIVGMTMLASKRINDPEYVRGCLSKVNLASEHLLTLINDVLDINKIESGKLSLTPTVFSLADTMMNLANIGRSQIRDKEHYFEIRIHNIKHEHLFADELRLNQIFINLLSNAVKYTPVGGKITIDLKQESIPGDREKVRVIFEIADTGIGMSEEFQTHMYEVFAMANRNSRTVTGSGVGLAICKQLVELMEGSICCESEVGKGTKFTIALELPVADKVVDHLMLPPMKMLLVDDDEVFRATASATLRDIGLYPDCVESGEEAVEVVAKKHEENQDYPLVIIDWKMSGMDGYETTKAIRSIVGEDVTVIVISAYAVEEIRDAALAAGANGFISKPFFRSYAYQSISEILGLQKEGDHQEDKHKKLHGMNVLVAEDNDFNWEVAREVLNLYEITSTRAENGLQCLKILEESAPNAFDVVLMDIQMPELDGYGTTERIRSHDRGDIRRIPVVAMTADAFSEDVVHCAEVGMDAHIPKPIDTEKLFAILEEIKR